MHTAECRTQRQSVGRDIICPYNVIETLLRSEIWLLHQSIARSVSTKGLYLNETVWGGIKEAESHHSVSDVNKRRGGFKSLFPPWQALSSGIIEERTSAHSLLIFRKSLWQHWKILCYHSGVAQCLNCSRGVTLCRWVNTSRGFGGICIFFQKRWLGTLTQLASPVKVVPSSKLNNRLR